MFLTEKKQPSSFKDKVSETVKE